PGGRPEVRWPCKQELVPSGPEDRFMERPAPPPPVKGKSRPAPKRGSVLWGEIEFRRLLEKLPAGAYTCDPEGLITYYNRRAIELWGRAPKLNDPVDRF